MSACPVCHLCNGTGRAQYRGFTGTCQCVARERDELRADLAAAVARAEAAERMVETQRAMLAFDATPGTEQRLRADLAAANARLAAAPSRDVPCVTCGHSIMVHQNNEAGGPCGRCDCEDGALLVNPPKL